MTLECILEVEGGVLTPGSILTKGKRYEILSINDEGTAKWYTLVDDTGQECRFLEFRFSSLKEEIRNNKIEELLK